MTGAWLPVAALVADGLIGDPRSGLHPVVLIGKLISLLKKILHRAAWGQTWQLIGGGVLTLTVIGVVYALCYALDDWLRLQGTIIQFLGVAVLLSFTISPRSLAQAGLEIAGYLRSGDMEQARFKVGWIVGRDTATLDESEVTRATVETVAENIVDGVISPLFFFCIGGLPLAFAYRAVNTMDSMIGYKNDEYLYFGRFAARMDDVWNWLPARLTFLLLVLSALLLRYDAVGAWRSALRDAAMHPSPNSGWSEAAVAGALGVQLGGLNYYGGRESRRAKMGDPLQQLCAKHIAETVRLMYAASALGALLASGVLLLR